MIRNKEGKLRSGWKITAVTGAFLMSSIVIVMLISMIMAGVVISQGEFNMETMEYTERGLQMMLFADILGLFAQEIVIILTVIIAWRVVMKQPLRSIGLTSIKKGIKELLIGLGLGIVSITIIFAILVATNNVSVESWKLNFSTNTFVYLALFIFVGFAEEIYSRGFIMAALRQTKSIPVIFIVPSLIFAVLHGTNNGITWVALLNLTLIGLLFSYMYYKSGNIWMPIGYHITWNYFQGNIFGLPVSGTNTQGLITTSYENNNIFNGGVFGPEGGIIVTAIILLGFLFAVWFYRNKRIDFLALDETVIPQGQLDSSNSEANDEITE